MIAQYITLNDETIGLCLAKPNLGGRPKITLSFPTDVTSHPISKRRSARTFAESARYLIEFQSYLQSIQDIAELRIFLDQLKEQPVAIPVWNDACRIVADINPGTTTINLAMHPVRSGAQWIILNSDNSLYEIITVDNVTDTSIHLSAGTVNAWTAGTLVYPLVFGIFGPANSDRPQLENIRPDRAKVTFKFKENSPFSQRLNQYPVSMPQFGSSLLAPVAFALPIWTIQPVRSRMLDQSEIDTVFTDIGFSRELAARSFGRPVARGFEETFYCRTRDQQAQIEKFFADRRGNVATFMKPTFNADLDITSDLPVPGHPRQINIAPSEYADATRTPHPGDPYLCLNETVDTFGGVTMEPVQIATVTPGMLTTEGDIIGPHYKGKARLSFLVLCRLVDASMQWEPVDNSRAKITLKFIEVPDEYLNPSPVLDEEVYLFQFVEKSRFPQTWNFTSYENIFVDSDDIIWTPENFGWSSGKRSLDPAQCNFTLKSADFSGNPLKKFLPKRLEGPLYCTVYRANAADPSQPKRYMFSGVVSNVSMLFDKSDANRYGREPDLKLPKQIFSRTDNWSILDPALGLNLSAIKVTGTISAIAGMQVDVTSSTAFAEAEDYFSNGVVELGTNYSTCEQRAVLHSEPLAPNKVRLILDDTLYKNGVGASIDMYPGYDGTIDQLDSKFGVRANHGGHPYIPDFDPGVRAVQNKQAAGGKGK